MTTDIREQLSEIRKRLSGLARRTSQAEDEEKASPAAASAPLPRDPGGCASDAEVFAVLESFGWKVAEVRPEPKKPVLPDLEGATAILPDIGAERKKAESPLSGEEPTGVVPDLPAQQETAEETETTASFKNMNQEILKEVFTPEELAELEGEKTHIFTQKDMEQVSEQAEEAEKAEPVREKTKRERKKQPAAEPEEPADAPEVSYTARDYRPIRRKRYYRTGLRGGLMYFGFVICVSVALASLAWLAADDVLSLNKEELEAQVYVGDAVDMNAVATELYGKGLIRYKALFRLFGKLTHADEKIEPGVYTLSSRLDYNAMIHAMQQDDTVYVERETVTVTIPEGKTLKQTFQILAEHGVCAYETLLECAADYDFKYRFLQDIPLGAENRLEGYLFPDTYQFYASSSPEEAINKFLGNFDAKVSEEMLEKAADMGYTFHEIVTVASLIEMEAGNDTERNTISSVIYNRLDSSYYPYLQIDATIQYALEERVERLTDHDLAVDSPYNTYKYTGLPPGPIANPGLASLRAALAPENTGYYFYALNKNGVHNFFTNLNDFNYFVNSSAFGG